MMMQNRAGRARTIGFGAAVILSAGLAACSTVLGFDELKAPAESADANTGADVADAATMQVETVAASASVEVSASQNTSVFGGSVVFTAIVTGNKGVPTGAATFTEGATTLGVFTLSSGSAAGTASLTASSLAAGAHTIKVVYGGNAAYADGAVGSVAHTVTAAQTVTTLGATPNPTSAGQTVKLTATVSSGAGGAISGTITFKEGATVLGTAPVASGMATLSTSAIAAGLHDLTAHYDGSANHAASVSAPFTQSVTGPNCLGLKPICGPTANGDCCASSTVPAGSFLRSYDGGVVFNNASFPATLSSDYRLDTYEVTVSRFRAFVQAGKGTQADPPVVGSGAHPLIANSGWTQALNANLPIETSALMVAARCTFPQPGTFNWTDLPGANENKPMNCVTWLEAFAFCAWDGGRLATEAEWNYAAAGGDEQRARPWSVPASSVLFSPSHAVYSAAGTQPVGQRPMGNGRWDHADLAGNVWEWTLDTSNSNNVSTYLNPCTDCANLAAGQKAIRGGGFNFNENDTFASTRQKAGTTFRGTDVGIRCARSP